ncbi:MAG: RIP metalloprotease RseP, partial [Halanaerobiales bacterium]
IVSFVLVLGLLIFVHEFGHFITAKKSDIRVEEFALGFGPRLFSRQKGETIYSLRAIPLGGFCNMTGEFPPDEDADEEEKKTYEMAQKAGRTFNQKSLLKRFLVIFMGPLMNFLLAIIIFAMIFSFFGIPVDNSQSTTIGELIPERPASEAGFRAGDEIVRVDGQSVDTWEEMSSIVSQSAGEEITIELKRNEEIISKNIEPVEDKETGQGVIGVYPEVVREKLGPFKAIGYGVLQTGQTIVAIFAGFAQMISQRSAADLGGPIMIASIVGQAARVGMANLLNWTAFISINLGILNLLPVPALDGGRLVFIIIEAIRGKPISPEKEGYVHFIGFVLLMILMVFIIYQDLMRSLF